MLWQSKDYGTGIKQTHSPMKQNGESRNKYDLWEGCLKCKMQNEERIASPTKMLGKLDIHMQNNNWMCNLHDTHKNIQNELKTETYDPNL